jgi:hypothetical protein
MFEKERDKLAAINKAVIELTRAGKYYDAAKLWEAANPNYGPEIIIGDYRKHAIFKELPIASVQRFYLEAVLKNPETGIVWLVNNGYLKIRRERNGKPLPVAEYMARIPAKQVPDMFRGLSGNGMLREYTAGNIPGRKFMADFALPFFVPYNKTVSIHSMVTRDKRKRRKS